uniref:thiol oxidase n=1 Tax=viral metagenome TaxID=1070528 RepID=A0A6C0IWE8_9ZZZZ
MESKIWGPSGWFFLHSITLNYPDNPNNYQKKIFHDFFNILPAVLPCDICKKNLKNKIEKYPIRFHLDSKQQLTKWLVTIHNMSNIETKSPTISYKTFLNNYKYIYSKTNYKKYIFLVISALTLIYFLYKYLKLYKQII